MTKLVQETYEYMKKKQQGEATGHDWQHTLRVYEMAIRLADSQEEALDRQVVELGALLHDIEDWKFNGGDEEAGPAAARSWLKTCGADEALISHIGDIIRDLSYKGTQTRSTMKTLEGMIVQDADRLDAVGAVGIARCFAYGGAAGNEIFHPEILPRLFLSSEEYKDKKARSTTVNHYYEKLFRLKELYNTQEAKRIGLERHEYMKQFLRQLLKECGAENTVFDRLLDKM